MEKLNAIRKSNFKKIIKINDIPPNEKVLIQNAKIVHGKYGKSILVDFKDFITFLPKRFNVLTGQEIHELVNKYMCIKEVENHDGDCSEIMKDIVFSDD